MAIHCINQAGREDISICQQHKEKDEDSLDDNEYVIWYRCKVCGREWFVSYLRHGIFDENGELIKE